MGGSSRVGKRIARRACDLCRNRRTQCVFQDDGASACRKCLDAGVLCTFLTDRKPRGPPSRHVAEARQKGAVVDGKACQRDDAAVYSDLPIGPLSVAHFAPEPAFFAILDDFVRRVYPVLPLIHIPSFTANLSHRAFETDPAFFRLCISLCAVTVASIPRKILSYGVTGYKDARELVNRASHLVLMSRITTTPEWQDRATVDSMVVSVVLAMASHYAGKPNAGWAYASEAVHFFRELKLYREEAYQGFNAIEGELCKRSFWLLFIIQIHDRMSFIIPHTGLSYDPKHTDWEFLLPLELSDDELAGETLGDATTTNGVPVISGFVALVKVFVCIVDYLDTAFPGPSAYIGLSPGALSARLLPQPAPYQHTFRPLLELPLLDCLSRVTAGLHATLGHLPVELRMPRHGDDSSAKLLAHLSPDIAGQFEIMRANVHITGIYIRSTILEMCLNKLQTIDRSASPGRTPDAKQLDIITAQLWQMKESLARELLDVLSISSSDTLESNGSSLIQKIREIAATFLDYGDAQLRDIERRSREYLEQFAEILANLDHAPGSPLRLLSE